MANEFKHATKGTSLTQNEYESTDGHVADSQAQGDILYFNGTYWVRLGAGTDGYYLKTQGAAANPVWASLAEWTDWTPTVTQSGAVTVTVTEAKYSIIGDVCHIYAKLAVTGTGTANNAIVIGGQPAAAQPAVTGITPGTGTVSDSGIGTYPGLLQLVGATDFRLLDTTGAAYDYIGISPNFALANGDTIEFSATYRVS